MENKKVLIVGLGIFVVFALCINRAQPVFAQEAGVSLAQDASVGENKNETAIALHIGHRESINFDLFTSDELNGKHTV